MSSLATLEVIETEQNTPSPQEAGVRRGHHGALPLPEPPPTCCLALQRGALIVKRRQGHTRQAWCQISYIPAMFPRQTQAVPSCQGHTGISRSEMTYSGSHTWQVAEAGSLQCVARYVLAQHTGLVPAPRGWVTWVLVAFQWPGITHHRGQAAEPVGEQTPFILPSFRSQSSSLGTVTAAAAAW